MSRWTGRRYSNDQLLGIARDVEAQAIGVPTGWQDYPPALYGGVAALEFGVGEPRRVALQIPAEELQQRIVLAYTGEPRASGTNNWDIVKRHIDGDREVHASFARILEAARAMRDALIARDWTEVARCLAAEWEHRKRLAPGVTTPAIDELMARARNAGALSAKVCGAGGGGCVVFFAEPAADPGRSRRARSRGRSRARLSSGHGRAARHGTPLTNKVAQIKALYLGATRATIRQDLVRAIAILKSMPTEEERERAAVYMDGLSMLRSEWAQRSGHRAQPHKRRSRR